MHRNLSQAWRRVRSLSITTLSRTERGMDIAKTLVSYFYYFVPFVAFFYTASPLRLRHNFQPIWPLDWAPYFHLDYITVVNIITVVFLATALAGIIFHHHRLARLFVFIGLWQAHALESSFGSPNHQWYMWVFVSLLFVLLPNVWRKKTEESNRVFLLYVWGAQALVALMYSMAGLTKIMESVHQFLLGQVHGFSIDAFAYQIAYFVPRLQEEAVLAPLIVAHPILGWFPYVTLILVQACSLLIMVRPGLQKPWAVFMILFHFMTYFTMGISFHPQIILVILLFLHSPFSPRTTES